ncbi:MAG: hypothetical protein Tsb0034_08280 [Ekhidna sp.]
MPFNGDGFHIMNEESSKVLDDIMVFFEQFRLPMLFLVSGAGTVYAFSRKNSWQFVKERSSRLLIPLIFGILIVVPPQTYFENKEKFGSYFDFYDVLYNYAEVNHLWFIENLFYLSVFSIPIILYLRSIRSVQFRGRLSGVLSNKYGVFILGLLLIVVRVISKEFFPEDSKDIANLSETLYFHFFFLCGIYFTSSKDLWKSIVNYRRFNLIVTIVSFALFYGYYFLPGEIASQYLSLANRWRLWYAVSAFLSVSLVFTAIGYGKKYLNHPSSLLKKLNEGIYPFYVLHQTAIVVFAYYIVQLDFSIWLKIVLLMVTTLPSILLIYHYLIYPFKVLRFLFGMKINREEKGG